MVWGLGGGRDAVRSFNPSPVPGLCTLLCSSRSPLIITNDTRSSTIVSDFQEEQSAAFKRPKMWKPSSALKSDRLSTADHHWLWISTTNSKIP